jgi:KUP system potassium uptake protein
MLITTLLITVIARSRWRSPLWLVLIGAAVFLCIDGSFFLSNILKIRYGGWIVYVA